MLIGDFMMGGIARPPFYSYSASGVVAYLDKSTDDGNSWGANTISGAYSWGSVGAAIAGANGNIGVMLSDAPTNSGGQRTTYSANGGSTFATPTYQANNGAAAGMVAYGGGYMVAVFDNTAGAWWSSNGGVSWTGVAGSANGKGFSVCWAGGTNFVRAPGPSEAYTSHSTDGGNTWAAVTTALTAATNTSKFVVSDGAGTVLCFGGYQPGGGATEVVRSTDSGATWSAKLTNPFQGMYSAAHGNGAWMVVAYDGAYIRSYTSTDAGTSWTAGAVIGYGVTGLAYGDGYWLATVQATGTWQSANNGASWTKISTGPAHCYQGNVTAPVATNCLFYGG